VDKAQFVREQLSRLPQVEFSDRQAKILCPFHDDKTPSLDVSLITVEGKVSIGGFNCWSCRTHGGWNKLASKLGLDAWDAERTAQTPYNAFSVLAQDLDRKAEASIREPYAKPPTEPWRGSWRGLSGAFLRQHGAQNYWDRKASEYRIWLPIHDIRNRLVGHVAARLPGSEIPDKLKYLNSEDFPAAKIWYCLNYEKAPRSVVVVEGPYDTLKFRFLGFPAVGQLGVGQLTIEKANQLVAKGVQQVVLAYDADRAGRDATPESAKLFKSLGLQVVDLNLSRYLKEGQTKLDPGECEEGDEVVQDLRAFLS
jgi:DNA primase